MKILIKRDSTENFKTTNYIPKELELISAYELESNRIVYKIGNGKTSWADLPEVTKIAEIERFKLYCKDVEPVEVLLNPFAINGVIDKLNKKENNFMSKQERVILRCNCGAEVIVFTRFDYDNEIDFDISFEDNYIGGDYKGFFGRIKRAWRAFWDKPVVYTGIYCEDKDKMKKFLTDCLELVNDDQDKDYSLKNDYLIPPQWLGDDEEI